MEHVVNKIILKKTPHTHRFKMADDGNQHVEDASKILMSITEKSGNLRKDLKNDILESVNTLRKVVCKMKTQLEIKSEENMRLSKEVMEVTEEMARRIDRQSVRHVAPSLDQKQWTSRNGARLVLPSEDSRTKLFSVMLKEGGGKSFKITLKAKDKSQSPDQIKLQLKKNINPTDIKVGIKTLKTLRDGRILIETGSK
jgi:hypothetical protein